MSDRLIELAERTLCWLGRHKFYIITRLGVASAHVGCRLCQKQWGMNHDARAFLPWDDELAQFHRETHGYAKAQEQPK